MPVVTPKHLGPFYAAPKPDYGWMGPLTRNGEQKLSSSRCGDQKHNEFHSFPVPLHLDGKELKMPIGWNIPRELDGKMPKKLVKALTKARFIGAIIATTLEDMNEMHEERAEAGWQSEQEIFYPYVSNATPVMPLSPVALPSPMFEPMSPMSPITPLSLGSPAFSTSLEIDEPTAIADPSHETSIEPYDDSRDIFPARMVSNLMVDAPQHEVDLHGWTVRLDLASKWMLLRAPNKIKLRVKLVEKIFKKCEAELSEDTKAEFHVWFDMMKNDIKRWLWAVEKSAFSFYTLKNDAGANYGSQFGDEEEAEAFYDKQQAPFTKTARDWDILCADSIEVWKVEEDGGVVQCVGWEVVGGHDLDYPIDLSPMPKYDSSNDSSDTSMNTSFTTMDEIPDEFSELRWCIGVESK